MGPRTARELASLCAGDGPGPLLSLSSKPARFALDPPRCSARSEVRGTGSTGVHGCLSAARSRTRMWLFSEVRPQTLSGAAEKRFRANVRRPSDPASSHRESVPGILVCRARAARSESGRREIANPSGAPAVDRRRWIRWNSQENGRRCNAQAARVVRSAGREPAIRATSASRPADCRSPAYGSRRS
jgi:hypothetical protein